MESRNDVGLCTKVVLDLLADYKHFGLHVYMDNIIAVLICFLLCIIRKSML